MISNTAEFNRIELEIIFGETALHSMSEGFSLKGVSIDTRSLAAGELFVALKGEKIDGHSRINEAIDKGACACLVEKDWFDDHHSNFQNYPMIVVADSLKAFGQLGHYHRQRFSYPVIAVGGSNGKTTTKEMLAALLSQKYRVLKTHENFNNQLGLPLMLLLMSNEFDCAVIEIGTNEPGEISILSEMLAPTHGLLTNIGKEHLEKTARSRWR